MAEPSAPINSQRLRKIILAGLGTLSLLASIGAAFAQVPPAVPALPDSERRTSYSITSSQCSCSVGFQIFGDGTDFQSWVEVWLNGVLVNFNDTAFGWTITSQSGTPLANLSRPITDGLLTFTNPQTGTVQIVGARRPRRTSQFTENQPVPARNLNYALTDIIAQNREVWDKINDVTGRGLFFAPGNTTGPMPPPSACANGSLGFDATGLNPLCRTGAGSGNLVGPATATPGDALIFGSTPNAVLDAGSPPALTANNLSDLANIATARGNLIPTHSLTLSQLPTIGADNILGNPSASGGSTLAGMPIPNCTGALVYSTTTHLIGCNTATGTGTVTSVGSGNGLTGGPVTTSGTISIDPTFLPGHLGGLILSNDSTTPNSVLDIAAGAANDSTNAVIIKIAAFAKSTAGAWASGSGSNGMGNGLTIANSTWYHVCLANNSGAADIWFDTSAVCANRPSGIADIKFRRIGSFKTDASAHILAFTQFWNVFSWNTQTQDFSGSAASGGISIAVNTPLGVQTFWFGAYGGSAASNATNVRLYPITTADGTQPVNGAEGVTTNGLVVANGTTVTRSMFPMGPGILTNTSSQVRIQTDSSSSYFVNTAGWVDLRGQ